MNSSFVQLRSFYMASSRLAAVFISPFLFQINFSVNFLLFPNNCCTPILLILLWLESRGGVGTKVFLFSKSIMQHHPTALISKPDFLLHFRPPTDSNQHNCRETRLYFSLAVHPIHAAASAAATSVPPLQEARTPVSVCQN